MEDLKTSRSTIRINYTAGPIRTARTSRFETLDERIEGGRRLFTIGAVVDGELLAEGKAYNKKDASQIAAAIAIDKLGLNKTEPADEE